MRANKSLKNKSKGNIKMQRKRRRARQKHLPNKERDPYEVTDGNLTYYPVAYCGHYKAYLSQGLKDTHRCSERECCHYKVIA